MALEQRQNVKRIVQQRCIRTYLSFEILKYMISGYQ